MTLARITRLAVFVAAIVWLTGCSGEPSSADIETALRTSVDQAMQQAKSSPFGALLGDAHMEIHSVKKLACATTQGDPGYTCDIEMEATMPMQGKGKYPGRVRMVHGDDGWVATLAGR